MEYLLHSSPLMKIRSLTIVAVLALSLTAPAALGADFGIRAGQYRDAGEEFVGAELVIDTGYVKINPNIEYSLADDVTAGSVNLDLTIDIGRFSTMTPYVGAGLGLTYADADGGTDETDLVGNLIGGLAFDFDFLRPYAQLKYFQPLDDETDSDEFVIAVGLRF